MEEPKKKVQDETTLNGFSPVSSTPVFWKSRKRSGCTKPFMIDWPNYKESHAASGKNLDQRKDNNADKTTETVMEEATTDVTDVKQEESNNSVVLSEKRKALFEPLEPITNVRVSNEYLLPPPDFDAACYPKGWLVGKKRKLVNVDVVESMRRIAVQEMNRKDREIDGLNEQLEEDARVLEHLQIQLLEERSKRTDVERQNAMLQNQITMLMDMLQENDPVDDEGDGADEP